MLPQYERLDRERSLLRIPFGKLCLTVASLPLFSFFFCIIWSMLFYYEKVTWTHCMVKNFFPSVSAVIGSFQPQEIVWQLAICLHAPGRFLSTLFYSQSYRHVIQKTKHILAQIACFLNVIENIGLLGLTLWTSRSNYEVHKTSFLIFIISSEVYMFISVLLNKYARKMEIVTKVELVSLKMKQTLFIVNITCCVLGGYFFVRHMTYCEAGVYSMFALCEYIIVLTNIAFHTTAYWDFYGQNVVFDWTNGFYLTF